MNKPQLNKWKFSASLACAALLGIINSASADVLLSDNFNFVSAGSQDLNQDLAVRQTGPLALTTYTGGQDHHQVNNTTTDVGQPGAPGYGGYVLTALNGNWQSDLDIAGISTGTLTIEFDMYELTNSSTEWGACSLRAPGTAFPVAAADEFGFLRRRNGGMQVFQNGNVSGTAAWDTANFALDPHWKLIFTDTAGTGSAFNGNGSKVTMINGTAWTNTLTLGQLKRNIKLGWNASGSGFAGIDNLVVSGTRPDVSVVTAVESGGNPFTPSWTPEAPSLIAGISPTFTGNLTLEGAGGPSVLSDGTIGTSGSIGGFATCGGGGGSGSTVIFALTNSINGSDVTNIVVYSGWGDGGRYGQYYNLSYSTVAAPTTYTLITTVFSIPGFKIHTSDSGTPAVRVTISKTNLMALASGVANIKLDFSSPPNAGGFNNGYQGYSEIIVQGIDTTTPPPPPSPFLTQDTLPNYQQTVVGDTVVFTAAYSNSPPATVQWLVVTNGVTNTIPGATSSTLTLNNVQTNSSATYILKAVNATNVLAAPSYSTAATLSVILPTVINNITVNSASVNFPSSTNFFPAWPLDTNNLNLIYGFTDGSGSGAEGTFTKVGDFTGGADTTGPQAGIPHCNGDPAILSDGLPGSMTTLPDYTFSACGTLIGGAFGQSMTYQLVTNGLLYGIDLTNITVFGGWKDAGRDQQKYQVLYSTVQAPDAFVPLLTVDYNPPNPGAKPSVSRTMVVPANGVLAHNVSAIRFNWNVSPQPENGWEGYSEILVGGKVSTGFVPTLVNDVSPLTASDVVGSQIILTASFTNYTTLQWKKGGVSVSGATSSTLTLNNLQLSDAGAYSLVASNAVGGNTTTICTVSVNPAPTATNNIITAIATQTSDDTVFTTTWSTNALGSSLIAGLSPSLAGDGDFSGGTFDVTPTGGSQPVVLTDGTFGTVDFNVTTLHSWITCIGSGTGVNNGFGGNYVTYTLPSSANGYDITNIMTAGGWNDGGRDQQSYTVKYATAANPTYFMPLAVVSYNPTNPIGYSLTRATISSASGVLASNVVALEFDMTTPSGENGYSGYSEIGVYGSPSVNPAPAAVVVTVERQEGILSWTPETPSLIAGQLPSTQGVGVFTGEGGSATNLTDGVLGIGGAFGAACGVDPDNSISFITFNAASGWNLTNIVVYTLWHDYGREGQFYNVSYSTLSAPGTFLPLASVFYNPPTPHDGTDSGLRVAISPQVGQSLLASNVAVIKFDFTPQGSPVFGVQDFSWTGYGEIVLQGDVLTPPTPPVLSSVTQSGGNLILSGTGVANLGYTVITTTNLTTPLAGWTVSTTGVTTGAGTFSNSIPSSATEPSRFFRVRMP